MMTFKEFIEMYDDWDAYIVINDINSKPFVRGTGLQIYENDYAMTLISDKKVISFGIYNGLLTIKVNANINDIRKEN